MAAEKGNNSMLYSARKRFNNLSIKIGIVFSKFHLSPNQWTLLTIIPILIALYFLINQAFLIAALFIIIAAFFDLIDGSVARVTGAVTKKGAYLDTIMDRYVESIIILGLLFISIPSFLLPIPFWLFLYLFGSMMTTYGKAAAKEKELVKTELKGGLMERAERMIVLVIGIVLASFGTIYLTYVIIILAILSNLTALHRIFIALRS
jgi:phosphatidylglycerophosphate synthase